MTIFLTVLAVLILFNFGRIYYQNAQIPELGVKQGQLQPVSNKPNNVSTQSTDPEKNIPTLPTKATIEDTMDALVNAVQAYGGAEIKTRTEDYLYVVFTTKLMKYHDDAEFWIDTANKQVHFRSASRAGISDMGLNRKRYEQLAELYRDSAVKP